MSTTCHGDGGGVGYRFSLSVVSTPKKIYVYWPRSYQGWPVHLSLEQARAQSDSLWSSWESSSGHCIFLGTAFRIETASSRISRVLRQLCDRPRVFSGAGATFAPTSLCGDVFTDRKVQCAYETYLCIWCMCVCAWVVGATLWTWVVTCMMMAWRGQTNGMELVWSVWYRLECCTSMLGGKVFLASYTRRKLWTGDVNVYIDVVIAATLLRGTDRRIYVEHIAYRVMS